MTMHAKRCQNSAALLIIMRCTNTFEPVEPAEPLSQIIKGQHAPWANPCNTVRSAMFDYEQILII